jgi:hypothetical protein
LIVTACRTSEAWLGIASLAGVFGGNTYARETASWAAQGVGQDIANLLIIIPALLLSIYYVGRRSGRALLIRNGLLVYVIYSYVIYAFFTHFNSLFLIYVALLSLSFYTLAGIVTGAELKDLMRGEQPQHSVKASSIFLMVYSLMFAGLWLSEIVPALIAGSTPRSALEAGFPVNPVHVLDLALALPAMAIGSVLLWRRSPIAQLVAVPMLVFGAAMGTAIVAMSLEMKIRGVAISLAMIPLMLAVIGLSVYFAWSLLRRDRQP